MLEHCNAGGTVFREKEERSYSPQVYPVNGIFATGNALAAFGWLLLVFAPAAGGYAQRLRQTAGFIVPAILASVYIGVVIARLGSTGGGFGTIAQVRALFADDGMLLAGWFHYLAFDLFVGSWITREGIRRNIRHWLILPCQAMTFLLGPAGLLLFFVVRSAASRAPSERGEP